MKFFQHADFPEGLSEPPTDVRTENRDRCHDRLSSPVGSKQSVQGAAPRDRRLPSGWVSEALRELGTALHHTHIQKKINHVEAKEA